MASIYLESIDAVQQKCAEILEEFEAIRISLLYLFEWSTNLGERVYTKESSASLTLDVGQIRSGDWERIWSERSEQIEAISEFNLVQSGLSFVRLTSVRLNWLEFQERRSREVENASGVDNNAGRYILVGRPTRGNSDGGSSGAGSSAREVAGRGHEFVRLLYNAYRLYRGLPLQRIGAVERRALAEFMEEFGLAELEGAVATLGNLRVLCDGLRGISVVVYNKRCNIVFEHEVEEREFRALLYWNESRLLLIKNVSTFLRLRERSGEYCEVCRRVHGLQETCEQQRVTLGGYSQPVSKDGESVLLTMYCDLEAICPSQERQFACCYSLIASRGNSIEIKERRLSNDVEESLEEAEQKLIKHLFCEIEQIIGRYFGWEENGSKPVMLHTFCTWCREERMCMQLRVVVGPLRLQYMPPQYDYVCSQCRSKFYIANKYQPVVFFHNFSKYDVCFVLRHLAHNYELYIAGKSTELIFNVSCSKRGAFMKFRIRDSLHFVAGSIEYFGKQVPADCWAQFRELDEYHRLFAGQKGQFAYEWLQSKSQLFEQFPDDPQPRKNLLSGSFCATLADLRRKCIENGISTVGEYLQKYCTVDVAILMFYFDRYRLANFREFNVDVAQFYSISSVSWYLAMRRVPFCSIPRTIEDYLEMRDSIRGGIAQASFRYAEVGVMDFAHIKMLDVNGLYSWCMTQRLPTHYVDTIVIPEESQQDWMPHLRARPPTETWICTVDLHYPAELHDLNAHFSFPLAPHHYRNRLCTTFLDKKKYMVLDQLLDFYVQKGLVITKWHNIQRWKNEHLFREFILQNIEGRQRATDTTIQNARKVANNALYGKTCENVFRYKKFVVEPFEQRSEPDAPVNSNAQRWKNFTVLDEEYVVAEVAVDDIELNKPIQLGFAILEFAKLRLYEFWFALCEVFGQSIQLLYTDTNSLLLAFTSAVDDPFATMRNSALLADYVDLPLDADGNALPPTKHLGRFSDELHGRVITAYVGLKAKSYVLRFSDNTLKKRTKGIRSAATVHERPLNFDDFKEALFQHKETYVSEYCLEKKHYNVRLKLREKKALDNYDAKHQYGRDVIQAIPWGYELDANFQ